MKNILVLFLLIYSTNSLAGVWYYGSGEAVSLENQLGFENSDAKIQVDENDEVNLLGSKVNFERDNTLFEVGSRNPERKNQINSPFFLESVDEISTNDATVTQDLTIQPWGSGFKCTTTDDDGYCEISKDSSTWGNLPVYMACQFTSNDNWTIQSIRDGNVINELELLPDSNFVKIETALASAGGTTSRYRFTSSDSGAELFGSACEIVPGEGLKTFDSVFRKTVEIDLTGSGDFTEGVIRLTRTGNSAIVRILQSILFSSSTSVSSDAGVIPEWGRPDTNGVLNIYTTGERRLSVGTDGTISITSDSAIVSSGSGSISYDIVDQYSAGASFATQTAQSFKPRTKVLSESASTTGVMSDLTFDDLEVGAWYGANFLGRASRENSSDNVKQARVLMKNGAQSFNVFETRIIGEENRQASSGIVWFQATSSTLEFEVDDILNMRLTNNSTFVQLTKLPNNHKLISELQDTLKYDGAGPMIGGYASFGGESDETVCETSPCHRHREVGELAENMSVVRNSEGNYTATVSGFKPNSPVSCSVPSATSGVNTRNTSLNSNSMLADATGELEFTFVTTTPGGSIRDTFFQIHCWGPRP